MTIKGTFSLCRKGTFSLCANTGEVEPAVVKVVPTHFMCPQTGAVLPVENPDVWVDQEVD